MLSSHTRSFVVELLTLVALCGCERTPTNARGAQVALVETIATLDGVPTDVDSASFGYNANVSAGPAWDASGGGASTPTFVGQVAKLRPQILRYPGGTIANYWHWQTGLVYAGWPGVDAVHLDTPNTLEQFKSALDTLAASGVRVEPVWTLNMMTASDHAGVGAVCADSNLSSACLDDQVAMLVHARDIGLPVTRVELGNEFYLSIQVAYTDRFADATAYANEARRWTARLRAEFPGVRIGIVGFGRDDESGTGVGRESEWNELVHAAYAGAPSNELPDGFILHFYAGNGLRHISGYGSCTTLACAQTAFNLPEGPEAMLAMPFSQARYYDSVSSNIPGGARPWTTEFNLADRLLVTPNTWAHGLYLALEEGLFSDRSEISLVHNISGAAGRYSLIFRDANQLASFPDPQATPVFGLSVGGFASALFARAIQGARTRTRVAFSANELRGVEADAQYNALTGWLFVDAVGHRRLFIVNASDQSFTLDASILLSTTATLTQIVGEPRQQVIDESDLTQTESSLTGPVAVLPWSLSLVEETSIVDAGVADAGASDAGESDARVADAGVVTDAGSNDAAASDSALDVDDGSATTPPSARPVAQGCACSIENDRSKLNGTGALAAILAFVVVWGRRRRTATK